MATIIEFTPEQQAEWDAWVASRPPPVRELALRFPPTKLYRLAGEGGKSWRVTVVAYGENGTLRVAVSGTFNRVLFAREVFGVRPEDLTECDLPAPGEDLGDTSREAGYTDADVRTILIPGLIADGFFDPPAESPGNERKGGLTR